MYKNNKGFTLIEMATVLTIVALIAGSGLSIAASHIEDFKLKVTNKRLEYVMDSIEFFIEKNNYIPCPAGGTLPITDQYFGVGGGLGSGTCPYESFAAASNVLIGVVPTATLGISPYYMLDGWNRRITYVVDQDLTVNAGGFADPAVLGDIQVRNANNLSVLSRSATATDVTNGFTDCSYATIAAAAGTVGDCIAVNAAVLIISHGKNGYGAWHTKGSSQVTPVNGGGAEEDENTNNDLTFQEVPYATQGASSFDDITLFRSAWDLRQ